MSSQKASNIEILNLEYFEGPLTQMCNNAQACLLVWFFIAAFVLVDGPKIMYSLWANCNISVDCKLKISNDALYNYAKSRKISSANWRTFQHSKEKTCRGHNSSTKIPPPHESLNTVKVNCQRPTSAIRRPELKIPTLAKWLISPLVCVIIKICKKHLVLRTNSNNNPSFTKPFGTHTFWYPHLLPGAGTTPKNRKCILIIT